MLTQRPLRTPGVVTEELGAAPEPDAALAPHRSLTERIDVRLAVAVGVAWFVLMQVAVALEPATDASEPAIGVVLGVAVDALFLAMLFGLAMRRRWGLVASFAGAVLVTAMVVACPTSGHHQFGAWWFGQMACVVALLAGSAFALRLPARTGATVAPPGA